MQQLSSMAGVIPGRYGGATSKNLLAARQHKAAPQCDQRQLRQAPSQIGGRKPAKPLASNATSHPDASQQGSPSEPPEVGQSTYSSPPASHVAVVWREGGYAAVATCYEWQSAEGCQWAEYLQARDRLLRSSDASITPTEPKPGTSLVVQPVEVNGKVELATKSMSQDAALKLPSRDVAVVRIAPAADTPSPPSSEAVPAQNVSASTALGDWVEAGPTGEVLPPTVAAVQRKWREECAALAGDGAPAVSTALPPISARQKCGQTDWVAEAKGLVAAAGKLIRAKLGVLLWLQLLGIAIPTTLRAVMHGVLNLGYLAIVPGASMSQLTNGLLVMATSSPIDTFVNGYAFFTLAADGLTLVINLACKAALIAATCLAVAGWKLDEGRAVLDRRQAQPAGFWASFRLAWYSFRQTLSHLRRLIPVCVVQLVLCWVCYGASIFIFTLKYTVPKVASLALTVPLATFEGYNRKQAFQVAEAQVKFSDVAKPLGGTVLALVGLQILSDGARNNLLALMPERMWRELPELPMLLFVGTTLLSLVCEWLAMLLPVTIYVGSKSSKAAYAMAAARL